MTASTNARSTEREQITSNSPGTPLLFAGGFLLVASFVLMAAGAGIFFGAVGADPWLAISEGTVADYLVDAAQNTPGIAANLGLWVLGTLCFAIAGTFVGSCSDTLPARAARVVYPIGGAVVAVAYLVWATVVENAADVETAIAEGLLRVGTTLDDYATILILGVGPILLALGCEFLGSWVRRSAVLVGVVTVGALVDLAGVGAAEIFRSIIIPVGMFWSLAAGISAIRAAR